MILRKIIKIVATRCQILRLDCTKFDFGWGSAPDLAGGAYRAPPDPLAGFKGPTSKERREGKGERKGKEGVGKKEREGGERGRKRGMRMLFWGDWRPWAVGSCSREQQFARMTISQHRVNK